MTAVADTGAPALFELAMAGGAVELRYRRMRPEVERLPWGTLDTAGASPAALRAAQESWTLAALQEHRTGAACAHTLEALIAARLPLDLVALATRFPLDEMVHVELCARIAMELGGGAAVAYDPELIPRPPRELDPLLYAADCAVRYYCVGEALSIPMLRAARHAATQPLTAAALGLIVRDEAAHGRLGWWLLDLLVPDLDAAGRAHLEVVARQTIAELTAGWARLAAAGEVDTAGLGVWGRLSTARYLELAGRALRAQVLEPLRARGIDVG